MKKSVLFLLTIICVVCAASLMACSTNVKLLDWADGTQTVDNGSEYVLELSAVSDNKGNLYEVDAEVYDSYGQKTEFYGGRFTVSDLGGYTIVYSAHTGAANNPQRTVRLKVVDNDFPNIIFSQAEKTGKVNETYVLPRVTVTDKSGGALNRNAVILDETDNRCDFDGNSSVFVPGKAGRYRYVVTAEDEAGNSAEKHFAFFIRDTPSDGEYESFGDYGCYYDLYTNPDYLEEKEWFEEIYGRNGVLSLRFKNAANYVNLFKIYPKGDVDFYRDYRDAYVVISMYVKADKESVHSLSWANVQYTDTATINRIEYNRWFDYVLPANFILNGFEEYYQKDSVNPLKNYGNVMGAITGETEFLIDKIVFCERVEALQSTLAPQYALNATVDLKNNIKLTGVALDYNVFFEGEFVAAVTDTFIPQWQGEYTVVPMIRDMKPRTVKSEFSFTVGGTDHASFNDYTAYVATADEFVEPVLSVFGANDEEVTDAYAVKKRIAYVSLYGEVEKDVSVNFNRRGVYIYQFTAYSSRGGFRMTAEITVGPIGDGEIFNANAADAADLISSMFAGPAVWVEETDVPLGYNGAGRVVKFGTAEGTVDTLYFNLAPAMPSDKYAAFGEAEIVFNIFVDSADVKMTAMRAIFFGQQGVTLHLNTWNTVRVDANLFLQHYTQNRLYANANWNDYFMEVRPTGGSFVSMEFSVYFGDVVIQSK